MNPPCWPSYLDYIVQVRECAEEYMTDFAFLNQEYFILAYPGDSPPSIRLFPIGPSSLGPSAIFELPKVRSEIDFHIRFRVDPPPLPSHPSKGHPFIPQAKPFFIREEDRILALSLWLDLDHNTDRKFGVIISMRTFLSRRSHQYLIVPWDSWSHETVWAKAHEFVRDWIFYIYGNRYAMISAGKEDDGDEAEPSLRVPSTKYYLEIHDFNPLLARLCADGTYNQYRPQLTVDSTMRGTDPAIETEMDNDVFKFTFGSRLPYRISRIPIDKPQPVEVAIDDERLIFLEVR